MFLKLLLYIWLFLSFFGVVMNWINFVKDHPGSLHFQRIGRSVYSHAPACKKGSFGFFCESSTLVSWYRQTNRLLSENN